MLQLQELSRDGFLIIDNFLDAPTVQKTIEAVDSLSTDAQSVRMRRGAVFARRNLLELDFVRSLIGQYRVRQLVDAIGPDFIAVRAILFDKSESANWTVPWHQDRSIAVRRRVDIPGYGPWSTKAGVVHVQPPVEILQRMLTLRFHLDPCGPDNGPLRVIAGTHTRILDATEIGTKSAEFPQTICATCSGGLLVMRPLILHASSPARTPLHRRVIHVEFGPAALHGGVEWAACD